jgi:DNA-directed RNA polymerase specialized sigma24 family protein
VAALFETDLAELRHRRLQLEAEAEELRTITEAVIVAAWQSGMSDRAISEALGLSVSHVGRLRIGRRSGRRPVLLTTGGASA